MIDYLSLYIIIILSIAVTFTWIGIIKRYDNKRSTIQISKVELLFPGINYVVTYSEKLFAKNRWDITPEEDQVTYITTNTFLDGHKEAVVNMYAGNIIITSLFFPNLMSLTTKE